MNASSAAATVSWPAAVRCTVSAKNWPRGARRSAGSRSSVGTPSGATAAAKRSVAASRRHRPGARLGRAPQPLVLGGIDLEAGRHQRDGRARAVGPGLGHEGPQRAGRDAEAIGDVGRRARQVARDRPAGRRRRPGAIPKLLETLPRDLQHHAPPRPAPHRALGLVARGDGRMPRPVEAPGRVVGLDGIVGHEGDDQHHVGLEARGDAAVEEQLLDRSVALDAGVDDAVADAGRRRGVEPILRAGRRTSARAAPARRAPASRRGRRCGARRPAWAGCRGRARLRR